MSTITTKIEILTCGSKDDIFLETIDQVLKHGLYAMDCDPEYIDLLSDGATLPKIYLNIDKLASPVQYVGLYPLMISEYMKLDSSIYGFNIPIGGRFMNTDLNKVKETYPNLKLRAWLHHPMDMYSPQVAEYLNNIEEFGYDEVVLGFKKDSGLSDIIITAQQIASEISVPVKIYHPAAKMADIIEWKKYIESSGIILDIKALVF